MVKVNLQELKEVIAKRITEPRLTTVQEETNAIMAYALLDIAESLRKERGEEKDDN